MDYKKEKRFYDSKLDFNDLMKIAQKKQHVKIETEINPFKDFQNTTQTMNDNPIIYENVIKPDICDYNSMPSLLNLSPYESLHNDNVLREMDINCCENHIMDANALNTNVLNQNTLNTNALNMNTLNIHQANIQYPDVQYSGFHDVKLHLPKKGEKGYESIVQFIDKVLKHFNALINLNKMTPIQEYNRKQVFDVWKQTVYFAKQGLIPMPYPLLHKSYIKDQDENTIAMILASQRIDVPTYWAHKPMLKNKFGETVAMMFAKRGIIPPVEWKHSNSITDQKTQRTVLMMFIDHYCETYLQNTHYQDQQQKQQDFENWFQRIPKYWIHNPIMQDQNGNTIVDRMLKNGLTPPKQLIK